MAKKCAACKVNEAEWAYQPWGPGEEASFTFPGHHYRGFDVVGVCTDCKQRIQAGEAVAFTHKRKKYQVNVPRLNAMDPLRFVREPGTLNPGGTHILIGDDPDWDVVMCGTTTAQFCDENRGREWESVDSRNSVTVGDLCMDCLASVVDVHGYDVKDCKTHRAYPA